MSNELEVPIYNTIIGGNILQVAQYFREPHRVEEKYEQWAKYLLVLYAEPSNKRVTIPLLSFFAVLFEYRTDHIRLAWKMKTTQKEPFKCSWWPKTIILGFEVRSWNHGQKTKTKSKIVRTVSVRIFVLMWRILRFPLPWYGKMTE